MKKNKKSPERDRNSHFQDKVCVVVPAYNEGKVIENVINDIIKCGYKNIIVVDDHSTDNTLEILKKLPIKYLHHRINRGAGAATQTGIKAALHTHAKVIVTMDSDGQHNPKNISALVKPILNNKYDFVIGTRDFSRDKMPILKILYNRIASIITFLLFGKMVRDTQSGFKAFSREAALKIKIHSDRYEFSSEIIHEVNIHKFRTKEVTVDTIYTDYSKLKGGQNLGNGFRTAIQLFKRSVMS